VVSNFIVQALRGEPITVFGDGTQTRSFCHVDDMVRAMLTFMTTPDGVTGPINFGNPDEISVLELAEHIIRLSGSRSPLRFQPLPEDDPRQRRPDISLARATLGWSPRVPLEEGLRQTIDHFRRLMDVR
jgi:UDP-glucuronate decarboxylase